MIKTLNTPSEEILAQIRKVESICKSYDRLGGKLSIDASLNVDSDMQSIFLFYEDNQLISVLSMFVPTRAEAEISAYTLPEYRRKGCFTSLLAEALEELKRYDVADLLFVCENQSKDGKKVVKSLGAELDFTEYFLRHKGVLSTMESQEKGRITLKKAEPKDLEAFIDLRQRIFNTEYEIAKAWTTKSFEAQNRIDYKAVMEGKPIGMGTICLEDNEVCLYGYGIAPEYQGKGFGEELLNLILKDLSLKGMFNVALEVNSKNLKAFNLYRKCGFEPEIVFDYHRVKASSLLTPSFYKK